MQLLALALLAAPVLANLDAPSPAKAHRDLARNVVHNIVARDSLNKLEARSNNKKRCRVKSTTLTPQHTSTAAGSSPTSGSGGGSGSGGSGGSGGNTTVPSGPSDWALKLTQQGNTFFDGWDFWNLADPTHGVVEFLSRDDAQKNGLIDINSAGNAIMRVETTKQVSGNRKSIRIHGQRVFNGGIVIMDSVHMPTGCGTWPAWWSNGPDWPNKGEIDIIEGVHDNDINQSSIHTGSGCRIPESNYGSSATLVGGANCASAESNNGGCGQMANGPPNNYGAPFNKNGGGVYALKWDDSGISIYFFPRGSIPADITGNAPHPENWGTPAANWPSTQCNPSQYFVDHIAIFDTTLCGDWAGNVWNSAGPSGQSCAQKTGYSSCESFVANEGGQFAEAYWEVKYVQYYEHK